MQLCQNFGILGGAPPGTPLASLRHIYLALLKEQGSYNLVQNRGHKGPVLRPTCIRPREGLYPNYYSILFYSTGSYKYQCSLTRTVSLPDLTQIFMPNPNFEMPFQRTQSISDVKTKPNEVCRQSTDNEHLKKIN